MTDSTYIRNYNSKQLLMSNHICLDDGANLYMGDSTSTARDDRSIVQRLKYSSVEYNAAYKLYYDSGIMRVGLYDITNAAWKGRMDILPDGTIKFVSATYIGFSDFIIMNISQQIQSYDSSGSACNLIYLNSADNIHISGNTNGSGKSVYIHNASDYGICYVSGYFRPDTTNVVGLGSPSYLWTTVYAKTATISTSDRTKKHDIMEIPEIYEKLFLKIVPVVYMFNDGDRVHIGAISQDIEDAMKELGLSDLEFAGFCKDIHYIYDKAEDGSDIESSKRAQTDDDGNTVYDYSLRYQEFIMLTVHMLQKTIKRVDKHDKLLDEKDAQISELQATVKTQQSEIDELKTDKEKLNKIVQALCEKAEIDPASF